MWLFGEKDVVVVGAGSAGVAAAISAARNGATVLLVEKNGTVGGTSVVSWVSPFMNFHSATGEPVIGGLLDEIIGRLKAIGGTPGPLPCVGRPPWGKRPTVTPFDPNLLSLLYFQMLQEAGVELLLHTFLSEAIVRDGAVRGIVVQNKSGRGIVMGRAFVDASGDGDLAALAGAPFQKGREKDGLMQPATLYFRVGGVDTAAIAEYITAHPEDFRWYAFPIMPPDAPPEFERTPVTFSGFVHAIEKAKQSGELYLGRETLNGFAALRRGELVANTVRVNFVDGTRAEDLTRAEIDARTQVLSFMRFAVKRLPGFSNAHLLDVATSIGIRESRRIVGDYIITGEDVIEGRKFDDVIARSAYPIDIHNPEDSRSTWIQIKEPYDIPYRALLPRGVENLVVAGRCISASHEAHASTRVIPNCIAMGVAAGTAAALAVSKGVTPRQLNVAEVQRRLLDMGANLGAKAHLARGTGQ